MLGILLVLAWLEWAVFPLAAFVEHRKVWALLAASCVMQDGHGMLPLLAKSRREFLKVKAVNTVAGLLLGAVLMAMGV